MTVVRATRDLAIGLCTFILLATAPLACDDGPDAPGAADASSAAGTGATNALASGLAVVGPWVRVAIQPGSSAPDAPPVHSAAYMVLRNAGPEPAVLVAVAAEIADTVELHGVSTDGEVMRMRAVDSLVIDAGSEAVLEPGGLHLMLIDIDRALDEGDTVPLVVRLRSGDSIPVRAPVRRAPPGTRKAPQP